MPTPITMPRRENAPKVSSAVIDRFGELCRQIDAFDPVVKEHKRLKEEIEAAYEGVAPDQALLLEGELYNVQVGAQEKERTIVNPKKAFQMLKGQLGLPATLALITIPLGAAIDKFIPADEHKLFLVEARTGSRRMKAVAKASPAPAKKAA